MAIALIKVGNDVHISNLLEKGQIFCNTIKYFRKVESKHKELRNDPSEGSINNLIQNPNEFHIFKENVELPIKFIFVRHYEFYETFLENHIFCLFSAKQEFVDQGPFIDNRLKNFGSSSLLIHDPQEFCKRIKTKLKELNVKFEMDFVDYYDRTINQMNLSVFHKPQEFRYQNEFRLFIRDQKQSTFSFNIGSIEDIAIKIKSEELITVEIKTEYATHNL